MIAQLLVTRPAFAGVRLSFLLSDLRELGEHYPPAREALAERRQAAEDKILSGTFDSILVNELIQLNDSTGMPERTVTIFDHLPPGHKARGAIMDMAPEQFVKAKRYHEMVKEGNPEAAFDRVLFTTIYAEQTGSYPEALQAMQRQRVVETGARALEALAGAGEQERALALAGQILQFDPSPGTRALLQQHSVRAGSLELARQLLAP